MMRLAAPCRALRAAPCLAARARLPQPGPQRRLLSTARDEEDDDEDELFEFGSALHSFDVMRTSMAQRPNMEHTALFLCDMQEKFRSPVIHEFDAAVDTSRLLLQAAAAMDMPVRAPPLPLPPAPPRSSRLTARRAGGLVQVVVTEQYPRGLGHTVPELADHLLPSHLVLEKVTFSMMCGAPEDEESASKLEQYLQENEVNKVLLCKDPTRHARPRAPLPLQSGLHCKSAAADSLAVLAARQAAWRRTSAYYRRRWISSRWGWTPPSSWTAFPRSGPAIGQWRCGGWSGRAPC